jgi:hypothetical protein
MEKMEIKKKTVAVCCGPQALLACVNSLNDAVNTNFIFEIRNKR